MTSDRITQAFLKITGAIRRDGIRRITMFGIGLLAQRGVRGSIRYALLRTSGSAPNALDTREFSGDSEFVEDSRREFDLDHSFSLPLEEWRRRSSRVPGSHATGPSAAVNSSSRITIVINCHSQLREKVKHLHATLSSIDELEVQSESQSILVVLVNTELEPPTTFPKLKFAKDLPPAGELREWILYIEVGDKLEARFLLAVAGAMITPTVSVITFDMVHDDGKSLFPIFLPGANPTLAKSVDYSFSRALLNREILESESITVSPSIVMAGWISEMGSVTSRACWRHIAEPLVNISNLDVSTLNSNLIADKFDARRIPDESVSIIICTKDKGYLLRQLINSLLTSSGSAVREVIIISNNTTSLNALLTLKELSGNSKIKILECNEQFNFSKMSNIGAKLSIGEYLLFLNDDVVPVSENWLGAMLNRFSVDKDTGVVGPLLLYPNEQVQHAGMYLGYRGAAGHTLRYATLPAGEYLYYLSAPREVSALTGAAMLVSKACFIALNGFDEFLATYLQDVDFSLRAKHAGFLNVFEPRAVLLHMESASIRPLAKTGLMAKQRSGELRYFRERWGAEIDAGDDFHNQSFDRNDETLRSLNPKIFG